MRFIRPAVTLLVVMTVLLGFGYPLIITGIAQLAFPREARGSLIYRDGKAIGSSLIGQSFSDPKYFWGRPSATTPQPYNGTSSSGSNLGPLNPALLDEVQGNVKLLHGADPDNRRPIPIDLVTSSASGLDPDISVAGAHYQAARVARARNLPLDQVERLIATHKQGRLLGALGEPRVNVLDLNLALDQLR
jgi:K+-transporting ATPase ATPase C chain